MTDKEKLSLDAIKANFGTEQGQFNTNLFISHHLEELDSEYWKTHFGSEKPDGKAILEKLVLVDNWSSEDDTNMNVFDFSLPENITDYMLSVRLNPEGGVDEISMES